MDQIQTNHRFTFHGNGGSYFGIVFVNWVLTVLTLGLYYPWAKERSLKYLYGETEIANSRFSFHGTGREMFVSFIKAVLIFGVLYAIYFAAIFSENPSLIIGGTFLFFFGLITLIPIAIHGSMRYRLAKTEYRGIRFGYRGNLVELMKIYYKGIFFSILTLGIYSSWMQVNVRKYVTENTRWGSTNFEFRGIGSDLFVINLLGIILSIFTLYIYIFWYMRDMRRFYINNLVVIQDGQEMGMFTSISAGDCFKIFLCSLLGVFTLGLALPWAIMYEMKVMLECIEIDGAVDFNNNLQTEENSSDATGDDLADMLEIDLGM